MVGIQNIPQTQVIESLCRFFHNMLRFFGEWCFIRWGRSSKKIDIHVLPFLVCLVFSPKEGLRSSQVNIMLARIYSVPAEWWDFKLLWGWESVLCTWKFTLPEDGWLEYNRSLDNGKAYLQLGLRVNFIPFFPRVNPAGAQHHQLQCHHDRMSLAPEKNGGLWSF